MIQALIGSIGSLASSYLEGKTAIQKAEATIRMKEDTKGRSYHQDERSNRRD